MMWWTLRQLRSSNPASRARAISSLASINDPRAFPALIAALGDPDPTVRASAASALEARGDPAALDPLMARSADPDLFARHAVVCALGSFSSPATIPALTAALQSPDTLIRSAAVAGLARQDAKLAATALAAATQDANEDVRERARAALRASGAKAPPRSVGDVLANLRRDITAAKASLAPTRDRIVAEINRGKSTQAQKEAQFASAVNAAIEQVDHASEQARQRAVDELRAGGPGAVSELVGCLTTAGADPALASDIADVVGRALDAVDAKWREHPSVATLVRQLAPRSAAPGAREILTRIGGRAAAASLARALQDGGEETSRSAHAVLVSMGAEALAALRVLLDRKDVNLARVLPVLDELGWKPATDRERALQCFAIAEKTKDWKSQRLRQRPYVSTWVELLERGQQPLPLLEILGDIGDAAAVDPIVGRMRQSTDDHVTAACASALGKIGDSRAEGPLLELLGHTRAAIRDAGLAALRTAGSPAMVQTVRAATSDTAASVRSVALELLARWSPGEAHDVAISLAGDAEPLVRRTAIETLARISPEACRDRGAALIEADPDLSVRATAAHILCNLGDDRGVAYLLPGVAVESRHTDSGYFAYYVASPAAVQTLVECGEPRVVKPLIRLAKDRYVVHDGMRGLTTFLQKWPSRVIDDDLRELAALGNLSEAGFFDPDVHAMPGPDQPVDCSAINRLAASELARRHG